MSRWSEAVSVPQADGDEPVVAVLGQDHSSTLSRGSSLRRERHDVVE